MSSMKTLIIAVLVVALGVVAYLYYQETSGRVTVKIDLPKIQVDKK